MNNQNVSYILFSSPFCVACRPVKEFLNKTNLKGEQIDASEEEGSNIAVKFSVTSLPTIVLLDNHNEEIARCNSINELKQFFN